MRGHLRKRADRSWSVVVDIGHDPGTGKRRQKWIAVHGTKRDAEKKLAEVVRDLDTGVFVDPAKLTLEKYLDQWVDDYVKTSVRPRTAESYCTIVKKVQQTFGRVKLTDLNAQQVQRYYSGLLEDGMSAQTVVHYHRVLFQAMRQAVKWDLLSRNVLERVTPPRRTKPELRILGVPEIQALIQAVAGTDHHVVTHLAINTGLRRSELCGLRWSDVDLDARTLKVVRTMVSVRGHAVQFGEPKSKASRRVVAFDSETEGLLREHSALLSEFGPLGDEQVCARRDGSVMLPEAVSRGHRAMALRCGIEGVRFHDLRHTHASLLLASGVPIHVVQARLGHESIQTTVDIYGHVVPASDVEAGKVIEQRVAETRLQNVCKSVKKP